MKLNCTNDNELSECLGVHTSVPSRTAEIVKKDPLCRFMCVVAFPLDWHNRADPQQ